MAEHDRRRAGVYHLEARAVTHVGAVQNDAEVVHFCDKGMAESSETTVVWLEAAAAELVRAVLGREHHPQAELVEGGEPVEIAADPLPALGMEEECGHAVRLGFTDVRHRPCEADGGVPAHGQAVRHTSSSTSSRSWNTPQAVAESKEAPCLWATA